MTPTSTLPDGPFDLIYADPPWRYDFSRSDSRKIENQYPTMDIQEICDLPVSTIAAQHSVLYMWATSPKLELAFEVIKAWGFKYVTCAVWDKQKMGMGYYFRQQHELLLVAKRGNPPVPPPPTRPRSVIQATRGNHSAKPEQFAEFLEKMYPDARKLEMFARRARPGWELFGNEAPTAQPEFDCAVGLDDLTGFRPSESTQT